MHSGRSWRRRSDIEILIPLQSRYVRLFASERARVPEGPLLVAPDPDTVLACLDKVALYELAGRVGVPTEPWGIAHGLDELDRIAGEVGYPCVIRPVTDTAVSLPDDRKALICPDVEALQANFTSWPGGHQALLVQHRAPGLKNSFSFLAQEGQVRALMRSVTTRTDRIDGTGLGVEHISLRPHPDLASHTEALVGAMRYTGYGTAQFMVSDHAAPSLLEINPRLGLSVGWTARMGIDVPLAAVEIARQDGEWHPPDGWRPPVGRRTVWTSRDLTGLRQSLQRGEIDRRAALRWLSKTTKSFIRADAHLTFDRRDPSPAIHIHASLAKAAIRPPAH